MDREIEKKEGLLKDIETVKDLKIMPLSHYKERLIECRDFSLKYRDGKEHVITGLNFELKQGDRVFLKGKNGCGKSSLIKYILTQNLQNSSNGGIEKRKITMSGCENLSGENIAPLSDSAFPCPLRCAGRNPFPVPGRRSWNGGARRHRLSFSPARPHRH